MATSKMHHMNATTRWHEEGLIVEFPGFVANMVHARTSLKVVPAARIDLNRTFYLKDPATGSWYTCFRNDGQRIESYDLDELRIQGLVNPAVILSCPIEALSPEERGTPQLWDGLRVDVKRHEDAIFFCNYVVRVRVGLLPPRMRAEIDEEFASMGQGPNPGDPKAEWAPLVTLALADVQDLYQKWCVG